MSHPQVGGVSNDDASATLGRRVNFGSAHLFVDGMTAAAARALLEAALDAGADRLDTAPLYGHGASEALVAEVVANRGASRQVPVTTKVGLEPRRPPARWRRGASRLLRTLPDPLVEKLRGLRAATAPASSDAPSGRFELDAVERSIERSLSRLGFIDRLLLHEVHPADITEPLLALLAGYRRRGDVATLGVATGNASTFEALRRSDGVFTVAHVSVDAIDIPWAEAIGRLPAVQWVGHGALGAGGGTLRRLRRRLANEPEVERPWARAVEGTEFATEDGLAAALFARVAAEFSGELLVASSRLAQVPRSIAMASASGSLPPAARRLLDDLLRPSGGSPPPVFDHRPDGLPE